MAAKGEGHIEIERLHEEIDAGVLKLTGATGKGWPVGTLVETAEVYKARVAELETPRGVMCVWCGQGIVYQDGDERADVYERMKAHDKECPQNPLVVALAKAQPVVEAATAERKASRRHDETLAEMNRCNSYRVGGDSDRHSEAIEVNREARHEHEAARQVRRKAVDDFMGGAA